MRSKNIWVLGAAVVLLSGLAYRYLSEDSQSLTSSNADAPTTASKSSPWSSNPFSKWTADTPAQAAKADASTSDLSYMTTSFKGALLPQRLAAMSARREGIAFDPQEVANALKSDVAWESDPSIADRLPLSDVERKDGREFVRMNPMKIEALMAGDEITLPIKQIKTNALVRMVVDEVEQGMGGNLTWHGHLKNFETENQVSLTRGKTLIVGGVSTPDKNYVVQIDGDVGWVVDGFTIFKGKHDAIQPGDKTADSGHSH